MNDQFPKKWDKHLPSVFKDNVETMDDDELEANIIKCEKTISSTEKEMDEDSKLSGAKDLVKDYSQGYRDVINTQKAKIKYVLHVLKQRGKF